MLGQIAASFAGKALGGILSGGKKTKVPTFRPVDSTKSQKDAIAGNLTNFNSASDLAARTNQFSQEELDDALENAIPGFSGIKQQVSSNLASQLRGELPDDVQDQIQKMNAERALGAGVAGSSFARNTTAKDLGLTSLQLSQQALNSASQWLQTARSSAVAPQFNVSSQFIDPITKLQHDVNERDKQLDRDLAQAKVDAAPDPTRSAIGAALLDVDSKLDAKSIMIDESGAFGGGGIIGEVFKGFSGLCWVAREVYGEDAFEWQVFREWVKTEAPTWFHNLYLKKGPAFARWIKNKPRIKSLVRFLMDRIVQPRLNAMVVTPKIGLPV